MRRALALILAYLVAAAAATDRALPSFGISYASTDGTKQASVGVAAGCAKLPAAFGSKKLTAITCIDQKAATAIHQAQVTGPYATVTGVFTNGAKPTCSYWWEGTSAAFDTLSKFPPTMLMVAPADGVALGAAEKVGFSYVLPVSENEGVETVSGSTGKAVPCTLIPKEQGAALLPPATSAAPATTTMITTTPTESAAAATTEKAAAAAEQPAAVEQLPAPVAGDAPEVKETGMTSPAGRTAAAAATWTLGLGAVVAAVAGRAAVSVHGAWFG